jgi:hypothetical protein
MGERVIAGDNLILRTVHLDRRHIIGVLSDHATDDDGLPHPEVLAHIGLVEPPDLQISARVLEHNLEDAGLPALESDDIGRNDRSRRGCGSTDAKLAERCEA